MNFSQECLRIVEDNKNNPHPHLYFMTMCLKHWHVRKEIYLKMKSTIRTESERRLMGDNIWGEDTLMERLLKENYPVGHILKMILKTREIEWDMSHKEIYDRNHVVIPLLDQLTNLLLPVWKKEVTKYQFQKEHPKIRKILYFTLNLRDYNDPLENEAFIDFFLKLFNEHF